MLETGGVRGETSSCQDRMMIRKKENLLMFRNKIDQGGEKGDEEEEEEMDFPSTPSLEDVRLSLEEHQSNASLLKRFMKRSTFMNIIKHLEIGTKEGVSIEFQLNRIDKILNLVEAWVSKHEKEENAREIVYNDNTHWSDHVRKMKSGKRNTKAESLCVCVGMLKSKRRSLEREQEEYQRMFKDFRDLMEGRKPCSPCETKYFVSAVESAHSNTRGATTTTTSREETLRSQETRLHTQRARLESALADIERQAREQSLRIEKRTNDVRRACVGLTTQDTQSFTGTGSSLSTVDRPCAVASSKCHAFDTSTLTISCAEAEQRFATSTVSSTRNSPFYPRSRKRALTCADEIQEALFECWGDEDFEESGDSTESDVDTSDDEHVDREENAFSKHDKGTILSILQQSLNRRRCRLVSIRSTDSDFDDNGGGADDQRAHTMKDDSLYSNRHSNLPAEASAHWRMNHQNSDMIMSKRSVLVKALNGLFHARNDEDTPDIDGSSASPAIVSLGLAAASLVVKDIRRSLRGMSQSSDKKDKL